MVFKLHAVNNKVLEFGLKCLQCSVYLRYKNNWINNGLCCTMEVFVNTCLAYCWKFAKKEKNRMNQQKIAIQSMKPKTLAQASNQLYCYILEHSVFIVPAIKSIFCLVCRSAELVYCRNCQCVKDVSYLLQKMKKLIWYNEEHIVFVAWPFEKISKATWWFSFNTRYIDTKTYEKFCKFNFYIIVIYISTVE